MKVYIVYHVCCDEEECMAEQRGIDHVEGVYATLELARKHALDNIVEEYHAVYPVYEFGNLPKDPVFPHVYIVETEVVS